MIIVETPVFTRLVKELMCDDEYSALQEALINRPDQGSLIRGSGGLRKLRWKVAGKGKSGGLRIIYYWMVPDDHIRMIYLYAKGNHTDLTRDQLKQLRNIVERW